MGLFSRKDKSASGSTTSIKRFSKSPLSTIESPSTQTFPRMSRPSTPPEVPKIDLPAAPDPAVDPAGYLRSIGAVRERCSIVLEKAKSNDLNHFDVDMEKFADTTRFVVSIIKRDFAPHYAEIPPHGRWQHFNVGGKDRIGALLASWPNAIDPPEQCRRLIDLFLVSVLLDAGAGTSWSYKSEDGRVYRRSEGLAIASLEMFKAGVFSSNTTEPHQVDGEGLRSLTLERMSQRLQVTTDNPITGLEGRTNLLIRLSQSLNNHDLFGADARPGNMLDYLLSHPETHASSVPIVPIPILWTVLIDGLSAIWPASRKVIDGTSLGDAWPLSTMPTNATSQPWESIVPFHKLSQWLCYSLMQPMEKLMNIHFAGAELMTGLPEYRNGGLFIDTGVLTLKEDDAKRGLKAFHLNAEQQPQARLDVVPMFAPDDDVIVEWRAVTVGFLDLLLDEVNILLDLPENEYLNLPQMLEAGSWKGGREMAQLSRPNTQGPPIALLSDGTVF